MAAGVVLVNGCPGSGKTWVARRLAAALGLPLLRKDAVKEALWDALGGAPAAAEPAVWARRLGAATFEVLWALVAETEGPVVVEAPVSGEGRERLAALSVPVVEVFLRASADVVLRRWTDREQGGVGAAGAVDRHPAHVTQPGVRTIDDVRASQAKYRPLQLGPVIEVDTSRGDVDVGAIAGTVMRSAGSSSGGALL